MEQYETDEQRGEAFKEWLVKNVPVILFGIAIGLGGVYGFNYYKAKKVESTVMNGDTFYQMVTAISQKETAKIEALSQTLNTVDQRSGYWALSQFEMSALALKNGKVKEAIALLESIIKSDSDASLKALAQYRAARLYFDEKNIDQANLILNNLTDPGFQGLRKELEGDIQLSLFKIDAAITAFEAAQVAGDASDLLPIKLRILGIKAPSALTQ